MIFLHSCETEVGLRNEASINVQLFENDGIFKLPVQLYVFHSRTLVRVLSSRSPSD